MYSLVKLNLTTNILIIIVIYLQDVVGLITDKCVINLINYLLDTKIEDEKKEEKEMLGVEGIKMAEGEGKKMVEGEGNVNERVAEKGESAEMLKREDGKHVEWVNESKMKEWEKVWLNAWNLEMERRQTAEIFADKKSQVLKNIRWYLLRGGHICTLS